MFSKVPLYLRWAVCLLVSPFLVVQTIRVGLMFRSPNDSLWDSLWDGVLANYLNLSLYLNGTCDSLVMKMKDPPKIEV